MAEQPKKPRKIKDLKARLGRTLAPSTGQRGGPVPPPAMGAARPPARSGGVAPPPGLGAAPPANVPGVAAPPFARPRPQPQQPADPFAAVSPSQAPPAPHEVRLVIDDKPVDDAEVGRKKRGKVLILLGVGALLGLAIGGMGGSMRADRQQYNFAVADGKDIYQTVRDASDVVTKAQRFVNAAAQATRPGPGKQPSVDYRALEALRALEKPLSAGAFSRKRYRAFKPETVDSLFEYYNNVNMLWDKFERLANRSLPEARRHVLDEAAQAAGDVASPTGCVPSITEGRWSCGLVFVARNEEGDGTTVMVRTRRAATRQYEKTVFTGSTEEGLPEDYVATPQNYVILIDPQRSIGVLGQPASEFAAYSASLMEIKALLDRTIEVQGRLEQSLGEVARLEQIWVF